MRLALILIALAASGCESTPQNHGTAQNLTTGTQACSKFSWGTSQMAQCLDQAAGLGNHSAATADGPPDGRSG